MLEFADSIQEISGLRYEVLVVLDGTPSDAPRLLCLGISASYVETPCCGGYSLRFLLYRGTKTARHVVKIKVLTCSSRRAVERLGYSAVVSGWFVVVVVVCRHAPSKCVCTLYVGERVLS